MSKEKDFIKAQIAELERLAEMVKDDPLMCYPLNEKIKELKEKLNTKKK